jgi:hypothetical protein
VRLSFLDGPRPTWTIPKERAKTSPPRLFDLEIFPTTLLLAIESHIAFCQINANLLKVGDI